MTELKLLPCPFCGWESDLRHVSANEKTVVCQNCGARGGIRLGEEAIATWNRRVPNVRGEDDE